MGCLLLRAGLMERVLNLKLERCRWLMVILLGRNMVRVEE